MHTYQLCWFSQESPNFSSKKVRALNLLGNTYHGLFPNFFINFVILKISKRKIKQGVDLALLLKLSSIGKRKTEQSNWYIFYEPSIVIWSEINQSKVGAVFARCFRRWEHSEGLRVIFREYSDVSKMTFLQCKDFLMSPDFCTLGVGRYENVSLYTMYKQ